MSKDLIHFKEFISEDEGTPSEYNWEIVESIYRDHGNSVAEMIMIGINYYIKIWKL